MLIKWSDQETLLHSGLTMWGSKCGWGKKKSPNIMSPCSINTVHDTFKCVWVKILTTKYRYVYDQGRRERQSQKAAVSVLHNLCNDLTCDYLTFQFQFNPLWPESTNICEEYSSWRSFPMSKNLTDVSSTNSVHHQSTAHDLSSRLL